MKKVIKVFVSAFIFVILFGAQPMTMAELSSQFASAPDETDEVAEEFEEYPVEDYFDGTYTDTECQDCLTVAETDGCLEEHLDCQDLPDCIDWLACVGWCEAYEGDDECYILCDDAFIDNKKVEADLRDCACEMCGTKCRTLCGVAEGY